MWKILVRSYTDVENIETFNYTILKTPFHHYHHWSHQESLEAMEKCQACSGKFSEILIFAWKLKFYQWQQILLVFLEVRGLFIHFQENVYQILKSIVFLSFILSSKNSLSQRKPLVQLRTQSPKYSSLRQPLYFDKQQKCFLCFWISSEY